MIESDHIAALLTSAVILSATLIYVAGWSYIYHYYAYFHIGTVSLEISRDHYLVFGFWVLRDHIWLLFLLFILTIFSYHFRAFLANYVSRRVYQARKQLPLFVPVVLLLMFWGSYEMGNATAKQQFVEDRENNYPFHPRVQVWVDSSWENKDMAYLKANLSGDCYRFLLQNSNTLYLFRPVKGAPNAELSQLRIPMTQVQALRMLPGLDICP